MSTKTDDLRTSLRAFQANAAIPVRFHAAPDGRQWATASTDWPTPFACVVSAEPGDERGAANLAREEVRLFWRAESN